MQYGSGSRDCAGIERWEKTISMQPDACSQSWLSLIAFGNQTISRKVRGTFNRSCAAEIHGFASLPHGRFAFIVCNRPLKINVAESHQRQLSLNNI